MKLRRSLLVVLTTIFALGLGTQAAFADSPHFVRASASISGTSLTATFKEAGLGTNETVSITLNATATATYVCVNGGGSNPSAANKTTVTAPVSATGTFTSGKNGSVVGSLTVTAPGPGSFTCPPGQTLSLASVTYTDVSLTDTTNNVSADIPGSFSTGCLLPNVRGAC
jgi:hypothetical protein